MSDEKKLTLMLKSISNARKKEAKKRAINRHKRKQYYTKKRGAKNDPWWS